MEGSEKTQSIWAQLDPYKPTTKTRWGLHELVSDFQPKDTHEWIMAKYYYWQAKKIHSFIALDSRDQRASKFNCISMGKKKVNRISGRASISIHILPRPKRQALIGGTILFCCWNMIKWYIFFHVCPCLVASFQQQPLRVSIAALKQTSFSKLISMGMDFSFSWKQTERNLEDFS